MPIVELIMPRMGESVMEATIINWLKNEGDQVFEDETVLEVATDKVDTEIPSPFNGTISKILHHVNDVVAVGKPLALIEVGESTSATPEVQKSEDSPSLKVSESTSATPEVQKSEDSASLKAGEVQQSENPLSKEKIPQEKPISLKLPSQRIEKQIEIPTEGRYYSPLVRNIARTEKIPLEELDKIQGTGGDGRLTKYDLLSYIDKGRQYASSGEIRESPGKPDEPVTAVPLFKRIPNRAPEKASQSSTNTETETRKEVAGNVEVIEMDRMRKLIADHMVHSKQTSAHVTSFVEADVTNMVRWRKRVIDDFANKHNEKLTFTPLFVDAVVRAIHDFPKINASIVGQQLHIKRDINIGIATAMANGNLIVPVIKKADELSLIGLAKKVNDLAKRARSKQLLPEEVQNGTFTMSNIGTFGNIMGTPIINQPEIAVLALGAIRKKPVVLETKGSDTIAIRHMMFLSLSYDHRIIDGFYGGSFLKRIADNIESFEPNRRF